jgi:hypothetical protein
VQEGNLIFTDLPRHRQLRKLINSGFTRRQVRLLEPKARDFARRVLDQVDPSTTQEFAEDVAAPLPTWMILVCWRATGTPGGKGAVSGAAAPFPGIELAGEVSRMKATTVPGVKRMPVRLLTA